MIEFKNAIVRAPGPNITNALSSKGLSPNFLKVQSQHNHYKVVLKEIGLRIHELAPLKKFPDSVFVEDPALAFDNTCVVLRLGIQSRFGESAALEQDIQSIFSNLIRIDKGKIEGGDILRVGSHFIVGLSERTDREGAKALEQILSPLGATLEISNTPRGVLHFKSECSLIDNETILATERLIKTGFFGKKYRLLNVPHGEEMAANCLSINGQVLAPKGFKRTLDLLSKEYKVKVVDVSEMAKVDAGLSCMSIRW